MSRFQLRAVAATAVLATAIGVATAPAATAAGHPAGPTGSSLVIAKAADLIGNYDVATNPSGTAYIGWIANSSSPTFRQVHLCTLPAAASSCNGGVQTISTGGPSATDLRVLSSTSGGTTKVTLAWFDNGPDAGTQPQGGEILTATAVNGLHLSGASVAESAPSSGELLDAELSPSGTLATLAYVGVGTGTLQVRTSPTGTLTTLHANYSVGVGKLSFSGSTPIVAITKYGAVSSAAGWSARASNGKWSPIANVAGTWTYGGLALGRSSHGLRLITGVDNASYRPVVAAWNGHGFDRRVLTADTSPCGPSSHDAMNDASGRVLDVSWECNKVTIANYADGTHAYITRFTTPGTPTATPQIAASTRGIAVVAWSNEDKAGGSDLHVSRVRLGTPSHVVSSHASGGTVYVTGPYSCLPAVQTPVKVSSVTTKGWSLVGRSLKLGTTSVTATTIDGYNLTAEKVYTLHGKATFKKGSAVSTATVDLPFKTC